MGDVGQRKEKCDAALVGLAQLLASHGPSRAGTPEGDWRVNRWVGRGHGRRLAAADKESPPHVKDRGVAAGRGQTAPTAMPLTAAQPIRGAIDRRDWPLARPPRPRAVADADAPTAAAFCNHRCSLSRPQGELRPTPCWPSEVADTVARYRDGGASEVREADVVVAVGCHGGRCSL